MKNLNSGLKQDHDGTLYQVDSDGIRLPVTTALRPMEFTLLHKWHIDANLKSTVEDCGRVDCTLCQGYRS